jgi:hypothetical protein
MRRAFSGRRDAHDELEAALERGIEGLLAGKGPVAEAAARPEQAFAIRPLLDAASLLRAAFDDSPAATGRRAELIAQLHWTAQQRPSVAMRLETAGDALWRDFAAAAPRKTRWLALPGAALAVAVLVVSMAPADSDSGNPAATLTILAGSVEQQTGASWQLVNDGVAVSDGAHLRLGAGAAALLTFTDGSTLKLAEHEEIEVSREVASGARNLRFDERADQRADEVTQS